MAASRRDKRGTKSTSTQSQGAALATTAPQEPAGSSSPIKGLSPPQFSMLVCISLAFTHIIDLRKCLSLAKDAFRNGVMIPADTDADVNVNLESLTNATAFCARHFQNMTDIKADVNNLEEVVSELGCTASDMSILNVKYQTSILRIALCVATTMICWGDEPLLKAWNFAYGSFVVIYMVCLVLQMEFLQGNEKYSMVAMLVLILTSSRVGRIPRSRIDLNDGLYNIVLFFFTILSSYIISNHLILGIDEFTYLGKDDVTPGGKAIWFMIIGMEYSILMVVSIFGLFYFDEGRKRALLVFMAFITIYHAFIQLPSQKDFWADASTRQNFVMGLFVCMLAGALIPSFDQFKMKR